jgi:predicted MFS family arabinose efflux permease
MTNLIKNVKGLRSKFDRQVWLLFAGTIINVAGTSMVMPFLSIYMYDVMGISMTMIGLAFFISTIAGALSAYLGGSLCDKYGRKKLFIIGLFLQVTAFLLIGYAIDNKISYEGLLLVLTLAFTIDGLYRPVPDVMIADVVRQEDRVEAYGLIRIAANLGWIIGPMFGGLLAVIAMSYSSMFFVSAILTIFFLTIVIFMLKDTKPSRTSEKLSINDIAYIFRDMPFLLFCIITLILVVPYSQMYSLLSVYSSAYLGLTNFEVGLIFSVSGLLVVLLQYPISMIVKNYRMTGALASCCIVFAVGFGLLFLASWSLWVYIAVAVITFAEMIWSPASATLQANLSPEEKRGRYFGFGNLFSTVGFALGPLFGGLLKDNFEGSTQYIWLIIGGIFLICMLLFIGLGRFIPFKMNRSAEPEKSAGGQKIENISLNRVD